ncbi:ABC transporter permease [Nocardia sp. NPDC003963]
MFVAWRDLRFARGRFALMGTVIVLITLLIGVLSGLTAGLAQQNISAITGLPADKIVFGMSGDGADPSYTESTVTERQWQTWAGAPGVDIAEPLGISTVTAKAGSASAGVSVFGVLPGSVLAPGSDRIGDRTAVLSSAAADDLGVGPGATLTFAGQTLTVAAVDGDASFAHTPVVWTGLDTWRRSVPVAVGGSEPAATVLVLNTAPGVDTRAVDEATGTTTVSTRDSLAAIGSYTSENSSLQLMRGLLFGISALVVGAFFTVWTIQRSRDVAVLKALGASTTRLLADALGQAVVLLAGGTLLGTALAVVLGAVAVGSDVPFLLTPATAAVSAVSMTVLGLFGSALSIRHITSVDPLTALESIR